MGHEDHQSFASKKPITTDIPVNSIFRPVYSTALPVLSTAIPKTPPTRNCKYNSSSNLNVVYFNANSIVNKRDVLDALLKAKGPNLVFITETWLKPHYINSFVVDSTYYSIHRQDRVSGQGGGVAVIYPNTLAPRISVVECDSEACDGFNILAVDFYSSSHSVSRFILVYLPPADSVKLGAVQRLIAMLNKLQTKSDLYLLGDFNLSKINWKNSSHRTTGAANKEFKNYLHIKNLTQLITEPTHMHGNTLDLFITSVPHQVHNLKIQEPLTNTCDHNTIEINLNAHTQKKPRHKKYRNYYLGNYDEINLQFLNTDWDSILNKKQDINSLYANFSKTIENAVEKFIPWKKNKSKASVPKHIKLLLNIKKRAYKRAKKDPNFKEFYVNIDKQYKEAIRQHNRKIEHKVMTSKNKKGFYSYVKKKLKSPTILPPMKDENSNTHIHPEEKANLLNNYFSKVFIKGDNQTLPPHPIRDTKTIEDMPFFQITPKMVIDAISSMKNSVSKTPDNIPSYFLKKTSKSLAKPLAILYNISIREGKIPQIWKRAIVIPVHKKGMKNNPQNYRPISLTSVVCRVLERIIHKQISIHLSNNKIISTTQHGFMTKRSTLTQHLYLLDKLTSNHENNIGTDTIYLDFSKAFDTVPHNKLIYLLKSIKINTLIITWITNYLRERSQQTEVEDFLSRPCNITSGVPQGSVIGPQLFTIFINILLIELENQTGIDAYAFADDVKILSSNPQHLQSSLDSITRWSKLWQLKINPTKSEHIHFLSRKPSNTTQSFHIQGQTIEQTETVRDLGIFLSEDLRWSVQASKVYTKSITQMYTILRTFKTSNIHTYTTLYKTYVRSIIEYNSSIWNLNLKSDIIKIESIQAKFTRLLCQKLNIKYKDYSHRLIILNLESLELRRLKSDLTLVYKIHNNILNLNTQNFFTKSNIKNKYNLRRHNDYLEPPQRYETQIRRNFFTSKIIKTWNKLPQEVIGSKSLALFKDKLDSTSLTEFAELVYE